MPFSGPACPAESSAMRSLESKQGGSGAVTAPHPVSPHPVPSAADAAEGPARDLCELLVRVLERSLLLLPPCLAPALESNLDACFAGLDFNDAFVCPRSACATQGPASQRTCSLRCSRPTRRLCSPPRAHTAARVCAVLACLLVCCLAAGVWFSLTPCALLNCTRLGILAFPAR